MNASKFKRMLKSATAIERHLVTGLDAVRALKLVLENEQAAGQAIGIASAAPAKAKRVKAERTDKVAKPAKTERTDKVAKPAKTERNVDRPTKVKTRKEKQALMTVTQRMTKKVKPAAPTEIIARHKKQKASRHEKIEPAQVKRNPKQRGK